jgi:hypothetical protein
MLPPSGLDLSDFIVLGYLGSFALLGWVYIFLHPDPIAFGSLVGLGVAGGSAFQFTHMKDNKTPDRFATPLSEQE